MADEDDGVKEPKGTGDGPKEKGGLRGALSDAKDKLYDVSLNGPGFLQRDKEKDRTVEQKPIKAEKPETGPEPKEVGLPGPNGARIEDPNTYHEAQQDPKVLTPAEVQGRNAAKQSEEKARKEQEAEEENKKRREMVDRLVDQHYDASRAVVPPQDADGKEPPKEEPPAEAPEAPEEPEAGPSPRGGFGRKAAVVLQALIDQDVGGKAARSFEGARRMMAALTSDKPLSGPSQAVGHAFDAVTAMDGNMEAVNRRYGIGWDRRPDTLQGTAFEAPYLEEMNDARQAQARVAQEIAGMMDFSPEASPEGAPGGAPPARAPQALPDQSALGVPLARHIVEQARAARDRGERVPAELTGPRADMAVNDWLVAEGIVPTVSTPGYEAARERAARSERSAFADSLSYLTGTYGRGGKGGLPPSVPVTPSGGVDYSNLSLEQAQAFNDRLQARSAELVARVEADLSGERPFASESERRQAVHMLKAYADAERGIQARSKDIKADRRSAARAIRAWRAYQNGVAAENRRRERDAREQKWRADYAAMSEPDRFLYDIGGRKLSVIESDGERIPLYDTKLSYLINTMGNAIDHGQYTDADGNVVMIPEGSEIRERFERKLNVLKEEKRRRDMRVAERRRRVLQSDYDSLSPIDQALRDSHANLNRWDERGLPYSRKDISNVLYTVEAKIRKLDDSRPAGENDADPDYRRLVRFRNAVQAASDTRSSIDLLRDRREKLIRSSGPDAKAQVQKLEQGIVRLENALTEYMDRAPYDISDEDAMADAGWADRHGFGSDPDYLAFVGSTADIMAGFGEKPPAKKKAEEKPAGKPEEPPSPFTPEQMAAMRSYGIDMKSSVAGGAAKALFGAGVGLNVQTREPIIMEADRAGMAHQLFLNGVAEPPDDSADWPVYNAVDASLDLMSRPEASDDDRAAASRLLTGAIADRGEIDLDVLSDDAWRRVGEIEAGRQNPPPGGDPGETVPPNPDETVPPKGDEVPPNPDEVPPVDPDAKVKTLREAAAAVSFKDPRRLAAGYGDLFNLLDSEGCVRHGANGDAIDFGAVKREFGPDAERDVRRAVSSYRALQYVKSKPGVDVNNISENIFERVRLAGEALKTKNGWDREAMDMLWDDPTYDSLERIYSDPEYREAREQAIAKLDKASKKKGVDLLDAYYLGTMVDQLNSESDLSRLAHNYNVDDEADAEALMGLMEPYMWSDGKINKAELEAAILTEIQRADFRTQSVSQAETAISMAGNLFSAFERIKKKEEAPEEPEPESEPEPEPEPEQPAEKPAEPRRKKKLSKGEKDVKVEDNWGRITGRMSPGILDAIGSKARVDGRLVGDAIYDMEPWDVVELYRRYRDEHGSDLGIASQMNVIARRVQDYVESLKDADDVGKSASVPSMRSLMALRKGEAWTQRY